jgi:hypothetical protein
MDGTLGSGDPRSLGIAETIKPDAPIAFGVFAYGKLNTVVRLDAVDRIGHRIKKTGQDITSNQAGRSGM